MEFKKERKSPISHILGFLDRTTKDHVGAYSAQAAYFLMMSFIPFILFLMTMLRYTSISYNMIREAMVQILPQNLQSFVLQIVADVYLRSDAILPITALTALWSAGKGIQAITNGLNTIYHVRETRNWLITRIYSVFYTLLFSIALIGTLMSIVLGEQLLRIVMGYNPILGNVIEQLMGERNPFVFMVLFFIFLFLFRFLPNRKSTFRSQIPGAFITAAAWMIFSFLFSMYFEMFPGFANTYGNMAALIIVMLWLDILMNLMLYGAEINIYFEKEFRKLAEVLRRKKTLREQKKREKRLEREAAREELRKKKQEQALEREKQKAQKRDQRESGNDRNSD